MSDTHNLGEYRNTAMRYDDEIDLVELLKDLWGQRWMILAVSSVVVLSALFYVLVTKPTYSSMVMVSPAPINAFGFIAGEARVMPLESSASAISLGTNLANDAFSVVVKNIESVAIRNDFNDSLESSVGYMVEVKKGHQPFDQVTISVSSGSAEEAKRYLEKFIIYVSNISAVQLNNYFKALGLSNMVLPESLYRIEQKAVINPIPIKPKKVLILVLGILLGGMLGVFAALIRLMLIKRAAKA